MANRVVYLRRPQTNVVRQRVVQLAPHLRNSMAMVPDELIARIAEQSMAAMKQEPAAAPAEPDGRGGSIASTAMFAYAGADDLGGVAGMPLDQGPRRGLAPIKLIPGNFTTTSGGTTGTIQCTPTKRARPFRFLWPSGQGSGVLIGAITALARTMGLDNTNTAAGDCFSEKVRNGGRVQVPDIDANSPITVAFSGGANSTTYYAIFFAYVLDETLADPPFAGARYRGERFSYFPSTSVSASSTSTLKTTPTEYFQAKRLTFDDTVSNFWSAAGVGLLVAAGSPTIADMVEELNSADYPLIAHSTVAEDEVVDFDTVRPNTAFSISIKNTNTSQSVTAQGHATGDMWE